MKYAGIIELQYSLLLLRHFTPYQQNGKLGDVKEQRN